MKFKKSNKAKGVKKVLAIISSPRKDSASNYIVNRMLDSFKAKGCDVTLIDVNKLKIPFSSGETLSVSHLPADVKKVGDALKSNNLYVFGVPNYWDNMPAQLKVLFDHLSPYLVDFSGKIPVGKLKKRKAIIVTTSAAPGIRDFITFGSSRCFKSVSNILKRAGVRPIEHFSYNNTRKNNPSTDKELLNELSIVVNDLL